MVTLGVQPGVRFGVRFGVCRIAALVAAVFFGSMASLYVPAARAAQLPRVPRVPDRFVPAHVGLPVPCELWRSRGWAGALC